jgi:hypothetical protein
MRRRVVLLGLMAVSGGTYLCVGQLTVPSHTPKTVATNSVPVPLVLPSPIDYFRQLLAMTPAEREKVLASKTPERRLALEAKLRQYERLDAEERELRLQGLKLRHYLLPLMRVPASNRADRLASIPAADRALVEDRLRHWDQQPTEVQREFLENEQYVRLATNAQTNTLLPEQRDAMEQTIARWKALPEERQVRIYEDCRKYFELNDREKEKTLHVFSAHERQQMERTLETFGRLPTAQRERCISGFRKFTELSPEERQEFLKNAQRWQELSPKDRQVWRALVSTLSAPLPPLPPSVRSSLATNQ